MSALSAQALSQDISEASSSLTNQNSRLNVEDQFRQRSREEHNVRHYEKLLVNARSTCQDLDQKLGVKYTPLWVNPDSLSKHSDELPEHVASLLEYAFAGLDDKAKQRQEGREGEKEDDDDDDDKKESVARAKETKMFCFLPARARLEITLSHLRRAHNYCLFCGHQYENQAELESQCPGEDEEDH
ncbi:hypothetical protein CBS101457_005833 [Exobasidium rhododendri]|nr:hypothetical protein CBS101457_005833 [Exobasidium rhododendri]